MATTVNRRSASKAKNLVAESAKVNDVTKVAEQKESDVKLDVESARNIVEMAKNGQIKEDEENLREIIDNVPKEAAKPVKVYDQHDLILCRSITPGWLAMSGKSGIMYVWHSTGDVCEVEYGDLWAVKASRSQYLYKPYFVIEDEELLDQPRWKDLKEFYEDKVYGLDNVNAIINVPSNQIRAVLNELSDGMKRAVAMRATVLAENGELDSIKKIKIIDEVCGTDILSIIPD